MLDKIIDIITAILPFSGGRKKRQQMMQDVKEFSELVKEQYGFRMNGSIVYGFHAALPLLCSKVRQRRVWETFPS